MKYKRKKIRCYRDEHVCHTVVPVYAAFIILPTRYTYARFRCLDPRLHNQSTFNAGMFQVHVGTKPDNKQTVNTPKIKKPDRSLIGFFIISWDIKQLEAWRM